MHDRCSLCAGERVKNESFSQQKTDNIYRETLHFGKIILQHLLILHCLSLQITVPGIVAGDI